ncbi:MAG TPA: hypothetical protein VGH50_15990 [Candidatus Binatia bacterium]
MIVSSRSKRIVSASGLSFFCSRLKTRVSSRRSKPTTARPSTTVTGTFLMPSVRSSSSAPASFSTSRGSNWIPFCERNSFVLAQVNQPGR